MVQTGRQTAVPVRRSRLQQVDRVDVDVELDALRRCLLEAVAHRWDEPPQRGAACGARERAVGAGVAITVALTILRVRFLWWPFHPIGLVLAPVWAMHMLATSVFIAWLIKVIVMRFGGLRGFRMALPFFLGLVLGDAFTAGMWALVGLITGTGVPRFLPG